MMETKNGYENLKAAVARDCNSDGCGKNGQTHCRYCNKFTWVLDRAKHYAEKTGLNWQDILNSWESNRNYWYMNYYQDCSQPRLDGGRVKVFDTIEDLKASIGASQFRCPLCNGVSSNPYACNSGIITKSGKVCDWKVYGLLGDLGKGISVFCKDKLKGETLFMPLAWE